MEPVSHVSVEPWLTLLFHILEVQVSHLDRIYDLRFTIIPQSRQVNSGAVPQIRPHPLKFIIH
jgi:hypothetical protein